VIFPGTASRFITLLKEHARYPTECNIIALIYTNRMTSMGSMPLTMQNWRAIWVIAIILAQKMWDDQPLKTSSFAHMLPTFTKQLLRNLEVKALNLIQFSSGENREND
jgi:Cyclin, N-terminal domain